MVVVSKATKALGLLARGLRQEFKDGKSCVPLLLEKFKEKKQTVVDALREALDFIFDAGTSLLEVEEGHSMCFLELCLSKLDEYFRN